MMGHKNEPEYMASFNVKPCPICGGPHHGPYNVDGRIDDRYLFRTRPKHRNGYQYPWVVFVGCDNPECGLMVAQVHNEWHDPARTAAIQKAVDAWNSLPRSEK